MARRAVIGIPWRPGDPHREAAYAHIRKWLPCEVEAFDADPSAPFSRAGSRNLAADSGVIVHNDADMLAPAGAYDEMLELARSTGRLVVGYHQYRALDASSTEAVIAGADPFTMPALGVTDGWSRGGIIAITPDAWHEVGGMDPRFREWGCEDWAFAHAAVLVLGPIVRLPTPAVHLWHPHGDTGSPQIAANGALLARYTACTTVAELRAVQGVT